MEGSAGTGFPKRRSITGVSQLFCRSEGEKLTLTGPMIKLALPGLLMVEAEFLAFEILTLASSYISTTHLAAQSILSTLTALTFQIPFPISIAASTRVANLIGATLSDAAKMSAKVVSGTTHPRILSTERN
jgi:Na+-driven multidrug efflux pump